MGAHGKDGKVPRFVALLGGINVGGHRVSMDTLRTDVASLGYTEVATFIASGNVLFTAPPTGDHESRIQAHLAEHLGWPVPTYVRTAAEILAATDCLPFGTTPEGYTHMVAFCRSAPGQGVEQQSTDKNRLAVHGREAHWLIHGTVSTSGVTLAKLAKMVGPNTTRNITSLERLAALLR